MSRIWVVGASRDGEEQIKEVCSSVSVHPQERQLCQPQDWGRLGSDAAEERVEPPSLP